MPGEARTPSPFRHLYLSVPPGWPVATWAGSLRRERALRSQEEGGSPLHLAPPLASLLVGGAAPWTLGRGLAEGVHQVFPELEGVPPREWTVEVGAFQDLDAVLPHWRAGGVTRISLRGEAADQASGDAVEWAVEGCLRAGFEVGVEVALPGGGGPAATARWVQRLVEAGVHALAWMEEEEEEGGEPSWEGALEVVQEAGWETPDLATAHLPGAAPRHREAIRRREPVLGLGPGAVTFRNPRREWNLGDPRRYLEAVEAGVVPLEDEERLTRAERCLERCWSALRTRRGLYLPRPLAPLVASWEGEGWVRLREGAGGLRILPTLRGWREADALAVMLLHALEGGSLEPRDAGNWIDDVRT